MQKNVRTIVVSVVCLLAILAGTLLWTRNSPNVGETGTTQPSVRPTPDPNNALGLSIAATQDKVDGNYAQAVEKLRQSVKIQPNPDVQIQLAIALLRVGKREEAIKTLREVAQNSDRAGDAAKVILAKVERDPNWGKPKP